MAKAVFINLPIGNLKASMAFYDALGFKNNPQFTNDAAACMVYSDTIYVMLHSHPSWRRFTQRPIPPSTSSEVMLALSVDSIKEVDTLNDIAQPTAARPTSTPSKTWVSCTAALSQTLTGTFGNRSGWTQRPFRLEHLHRPVTRR